MHQSYRDIRDRIAEPPTWFDSDGVPRYGPFDPSMSPNIYADEVALLRIACQACQEQFLVEMHSSWRFNDNNGYSRRVMLSDRGVGNLHYGDPPFMGDAPETQ